MRTPLGALIPLLLLGCTKDDTDDTGEVAVHPCLEGCWADAPSDALYVCEEGDDAAVGSAEAPLLTIAAAVEASREEDAPRSIRIGGGTYVETLSLYTAAGTVDDGLSLTGCAAEEAVIQAEDDDAPVIKVSAVDGLSLADLTLKGGRRALWIWQGAQVTVDGVIVEDSTRVGVVIDGSTTLLTADGLEVHDVSDDLDRYGEGFGYGITVKDAELIMTGGAVTGAIAAGIMVTGHEADATLDGVVVSGIEPDAADLHGHGLMVQEWAQATVIGGSFADTHDAAITGMKAMYLGVDGAAISATTAAAVPDSSDRTGDGIVVSRGDTGFKPTSFECEIEGTTVTGSDRAGIVFDGVAIYTASGNTLSDNGYAPDGTSIIVQGEAMVIDKAPDDFYEIVDPGSYLGLNVLSLEVDDLIDE